MQILAASQKRMICFKIPSSITLKAFPPSLMRTAFRSLLALSLTTLLLAACGDAAKESAIENTIKEETGNEADVKVNDNNVRVTTSEGTVTYGEQKLPVDWPKDVPVYPGSTVQMSGAAAQGLGAIFLINEEMSKVVAYYKEQLAASGWKIEIAADLGDGTVIGASKETRQLSMNFSKGEKQTTLTIGMQEKAAP